MLVNFRIGIRKLFISGFALLFISTSTLVPAATEDVQTRVIGGEIASIGAYPWAVAILNAFDPDPGSAQFCAGTLISPKWAWYTSATPWQEEVLDTATNGTAMRSGSIEVDGLTALTTYIEGPGTVSFDWKVSSGASEPDIDFLQLTIGGEVSKRITGITEWANEEVAIGKGTHAVSWAYHKNSHFAFFGSDTAWLDNVIFALCNEESEAK